MCGESVPKPVYDLQVSYLKQIDEDQENRLKDLENRVEGQFQKFLMYLSILGSLLIGTISLIHSFLK